MKNDEWKLTKELGKLRKYKINLQARRKVKNKIYDIIYEKDEKIFEPYCTVQEIIGIINAIDKIMKEKENEMAGDGQKREKTYC